MLSSLTPPKMDKAPTPEPVPSTAEGPADQGQDLTLEKSGTFRVRVKRVKPKRPKPGVSLHKAKKPWTPPSILKRKGGNNVGVGGSGSGDSVPVSTVKKSRAILNKITPTSFDQLLSEFLALSLETNEEIRGVIKVLVGKAINEPSYSEMYVRMVEKICEASSISVKFRKLLLDQCRKEFLNRNGYQKKLEAVKKRLAAATDDKIRQGLESDFEDIKYLGRIRSLGTLRFLGELYKKQFLSLNVMVVDLVQVLLLPLGEDELELERLCVLLTTIGGQLDLEIKSFKERASLWEQTRLLPESSWVDKIFSKLEALSKDEKLSFRMRFKIVDLVELRQADWKPRRVIPSPKTIEEIRAEAKSQSLFKFGSRPNKTSTSLPAKLKHDKKIKSGKPKPEPKSLATAIKRASQSLFAFTQQESEALKDSKLQLLKRIRECAAKMESILVDKENQ